MRRLELEYLEMKGSRSPKGQRWKGGGLKRGSNKSHSLSSSKCVSMPSAPGTEQMSRAFRNVLHLLTRQQCPPSSFCRGEDAAVNRLEVKSSDGIPAWGGQVANCDSGSFNSPNRFAGLGSGNLVSIYGSLERSLPSAVFAFHLEIGGIWRKICNLGT